METLEETLKYWKKDIQSDEKIRKYFDCKVIKEFSMGSSSPFWMSWQEFGTHKNVWNWWLLENGIAVGFNESPSIGWSWPVKKLSKEMFDKAVNHNKNYEQYYNIENDNENVN